MNNIEKEIRNLQKKIKKMMKEKNMIAKHIVRVISDMINDEWSQDKIEQIRDKRGGKK